MDLLSRYGLFLLQTVTLVLAAAAVMVLAAVLVTRATKSRQSVGKGLEVKHLNRTFEDLAFALESRLMPPKAAKARAKAIRRARKASAAGTSGTPSGRPAGGSGEGPAGGSTGGVPGGSRPRVFVLDFHGDIRATEVAGLREEVTAVVANARPGDEVVVRLENPGGTVHDQGFAAAQLSRFRDRGVRLTIAVDKVAASGGYMMACVADRILASPFAIVGSIGVIAQIPNVYRLLDRTGIEVEQVTAGEFKRTVTPFTRTTPEQREKLTSQLTDMHTLFKEYVARYRPGLDVERVGTGEAWVGTRALELGLVDELTTSDDYLLARAAEADVYAVRWQQGHSPARKLATLVNALTARQVHPA